ncbi:MAG: efflux transporter outer membrane subunit [Sphingomonadaceae bacterium]|nr:efflux transporter outer membrane subunit [Sphingomonadaceae bacterium]
MIRTASIRFRAAASLAVLACAGCVPHVDLETPPQVVSTQWSRSALGSQGGAAQAGVQQPLSADLGAMLHSAELSFLLARADTANTDVAIAGTRIRQARALLRNARGAMLPLISASAGISGSRTRPAAVGASRAFDFSNAFGSLDVAFDLDLFGGARAGRDAARSRLRAATFDREAVRLVVQSEVARAYVQRAALAARIAIARRNVTDQEELERIIRARVAAGDATRVDLGLQTIQVRQLQTDAQRLDQALDQTRTALAVLVGEEAPRFALPPADLESLSPPAIAPVLPGELVTRRPDIRAAEARIDAAGGDVRQARAAFFPSLSLSAGGLLQTANLSNPLTSVVSLGAGLLAPIFNRGRLRGNLELSAAQQAEMVELYRRVLLTSLAEVEDALSAVGRSGERETLLVDVVREAQLTARLSRMQYLSGDADLQHVLDAEQRLAEAEDARAVALQERLEAAIDLYKALGGAAV